MWVGIKRNRIRDFVAFGSEKGRLMARKKEKYFTEEMIYIRDKILSGMCPFCKSGPYKVIALHVYQVHRIDRHELREKAGLNAGTSICSSESAEKHRQSVMSRDMSSFLEYDRSKIATIRRKGDRPEGYTNRLSSVSEPERVKKFVKRVSVIDRREQALRIPPEIRKKNARKAAKALHEKLGPEKSRSNMLQARSMRKPLTPEQHIKRNKTMEKYRNDPEWIKMVGQRIREARGNMERDKEICEFIINNPEYSHKIIAERHGLSQSRINQILKAQQK